jgi:phosphatidylserine/phosphatidylglycerophosphate/cardiolipin synthase-like enzyme
MGQPPRWQPYGAGLALANRGEAVPAASFVAGVHHPILNPVTGLLGVSAEGYGTAGGAFPGVGVRALAASPVLALGAGADWNVDARRVDFLLSYQTAVLRGGLIGRGSMLRIDWLPTRGRTVGIGLQVPVMQPYAGRTRPRRTTASLPPERERVTADASTMPPTANALLDSVARAAKLLRVYGSLYSEDDEHAVRDGVSNADAMRVYHGALGRAFETVAGDATLGAAITRRARAGALSELLLPYDALFGQAKDDDDLAPLRSRTAASFARWVRDSSRITPGARATVIAVHSRWLDILAGVHDDLRARWKDSRTIWLPLPLALTADQYDEQTEVDSLLARAVQRPFTDGNALTLLQSSDLTLAIARSIYAAREYHAFWIHDFTGRRDETGELDNVGYEMVADVYLPALTAAVKRYDAVGRLPAYMILIDQFWYEPRDGRLWMSILERPLDASMRLPGDNAAREAHLRERQAELRAAVAASVRLQADAARSGGEGWLKRVVKVHVSVPYPADFSFRSHRIVPPIPFTPDNVMRDHRKIALFDLDEADPFRGAMFLMGIGIGEHYASATWEDRGYRIRGPAALEARAALRRLLRANGFADEDIPPPLREVTNTETVERRMNAGDYVGRALQVHNEVGFGAKESSVARALLYDLAQPGSVVVVPDPLWIGAEWAAMLAGAAARGARVHVIAPALENAPSPEAPLMALSHDVMQRLLEIRARLGERITGAGGELRVGLFAARAHVDDAAGRRREVQEGLRRAPWIRELIPFDAAALAVLDRAEARIAADGREPTSLARDVKPRPPQLHHKTQLIARPGAIAAFVRQPGWEDVLARTMQAQARETARLAEQLGDVTADVESEALRSTDALLLGYQRGVPEAERKRVSFYYTLGTQNHDPRGMMLDGEATLVVSGIPAAAGLVDLYYQMARSSWITTPAELDRLLPPPSGWMRRAARLIRPSL